jgi:hypothetical protein
MPWKGSEGMKKKAITLLLILMFMFQVVSTVSATQIDPEEISNAELLRKYTLEFTEMENELKEIEVKLNAANEFESNNENIKEGVLTRNIQEEGSMVTLAIPYSLTGIDYQPIVTHAKLYTRSVWEEDSDWGSLKSVEGRVLEIYDGATCLQIEVEAGQWSAVPGGGKTKPFVEYKDNYYEEFDWPEIAFVPNHHDLGHTADFTIVRGIKTEKWRVVCNKNERDHWKIGD